MNFKIIRASMAFVVCMASANPLIAQERTAGNAMDVQMTWSTLKTLVDGANQKTEAVDSKIEQNIKCNAKAKLYVPSAPANLKDTDGCIDNKPLIDLTDRVKVTEVNLEKLLKCGETGQSYNRLTNSCTSGKDKFDHMEVLFAGKTSCTQRVKDANLYVGNSNTSQYNGLTSTILTGVNGDWMIENMDRDCSPMSNNSALIIYVPKDADNKPIKGYFKKVLK